MKMKTILKWIIGLMVINCPFTMENSNYYHQSFKTKNNTTYNKSFKIPSINSLMKKTLLPLIIINFGFGRNDTGFIDGDDTEIKEIDNCPYWLNKLLPFPGNTIKTINGLDYKIYCDLNTRDVIYFCQRCQMAYYNILFPYYSIKYLNKENYFSDKTLKEQAKSLYENVILFDSVETNKNFNENDKHNKDMIFYSLLVQFEVTDRNNNGFFDETIESNQIHFAPNYFGKNITDPNKREFSNEELRNQTIEIANKYQHINHLVSEYKFHYRDGSIVNCHRQNFGKNLFFCLNIDRYTTEIIDDYPLDQKISYPNGPKPKQCPPIYDIYGVDNNENCLFNVNKNYNFTLIDTPQNLTKKMPIKPNTTTTIQDLSYDVDSFKTNLGQFVQYLVSNNKIFHRFISIYEGFQFLFNPMVYNLKNLFLYDSVVLFDSTNNCAFTVNDNNDIISYSICSYYKNNNLLLNSNQHHLNPCISGKDSNGKSLTEEALQKKRLDIVEKYKDMNHNVFKYQFHYRNGNRVDFFISKCCSKSNTKLICYYKFEEYLFNHDGFEINSLIEQIPFAESPWTHKISSDLLTMYQFLTYEDADYSFLYPKILGINGVDYNEDGNFILYSNKNKASLRKVSLEKMGKILETSLILSTILILSFVF